MYLDYFKKILRINLVYYGIPFSGKSTTISMVLERTSPGSCQPVSFYGLDTERGIFGECIPKASKALPFQVLLTLLTIPGYSGYVYDKAHKMLLSKADGILFVADSQKGRIEQNDAYFGVMHRRVRELHGQSLLEFPLAVQWNKVDTESSVSIQKSKIHSQISESYIFETSAVQGKGILEALNFCLSQVCKKANLVDLVVQPRGSDVAN